MPELGFKEVDEKVISPLTAQGIGDYLAAKGSAVPSTGVLVTPTGYFYQFTVKNSFYIDKILYQTGGSSNVSYNFDIGIYEMDYLNDTSIDRIWSLGATAGIASGLHEITCGITLARGSYIVGMSVNNSSFTLYTLTVPSPSSASVNFTHSSCHPMPSTLSSLARHGTVPLIILQGLDI